MSEEKVIELSKVKIILLTLGAVAFVLLGVWLLSMDAKTIESQRKFNSPILVYGIGVVSIVFFGLCGFIGIKKLFDKSPGLIINSEGILDNSSGVSAGIIPWAEIVGIGEYQIHKQKFISIQVKDPEKYVNTGNALKRMANRANIKMCGTPVNISANSLKINYDDLLKIITEYYRSSHQNA
ncbi:hypothetical protein ORJ04_21745 [Rheinheimera baltica]|uniref:Uncharacterized protein n=1 Tax=Rheinheimera baltica TaxID=67576 RepID=A0ABT9I5D4_9GAMM|nr:STM3941 family protein [Rheinheimera baltica]MDP5138574.1 hypothetical protein [Rheinheimera baltica]